MATYEVKIGLSWPSTGGPGVNVWHLRAEANADIENLTEALRVYYVGLINSGLTPDGYTVAFDGQAIDVQDQSIDTVDDWSHTSESGSPNFTALASQVCVTKKTANASRSGRGRVFHGPLTPEAIQSDGSVNNTMRASLQAAADALVASSEGEISGALGVYSKTNLLFRDLTDLTVRDYVAVLRSRRD